jgi:hypothetical protein
MYLSLALAMVGNDGSAGPANGSGDVGEVLEPALDRIRQLIATFRGGRVTPQATAQFEKDLQQATRELARSAMQWTCNQLEPAAPADLPPQVQFEGTGYRRLGHKTPQAVSTLFGTITLQRLGYRAAAADGEPVLFPLCRALGGFVV